MDDDVVELVAGFSAGAGMTKFAQLPTRIPRTSARSRKSRVREPDQGASHRREIA